MSSRKWKPIDIDDIKLGDKVWAKSRTPGRGYRGRVTSVSGQWAGVDHVSLELFHYEWFIKIPKADREPKPPRLHDGLTAKQWNKFWVESEADVSTALDRVEELERELALVIAGAGKDSDETAIKLIDMEKSRDYQKEQARRADECVAELESEVERLRAEKECREPVPQTANLSEWRNSKGEIIPGSFIVRPPVSSTPASPYSTGGFMTQEDEDSADASMSAVVVTAEADYEGLPVGSVVAGFGMMAITWTKHLGKSWGNDVETSILASSTLAASGTREVLRRGWGES